MTQDKGIYLIKGTDSKGELHMALGINVELFNNGLLAELTGNELKVLVAIASYMDDNGECFPSQATLAKRVNVAESTVGLCVNSLLKKRVNKKLILKRKIVGTGLNKMSVYSFPSLYETEDDSDLEMRMTAPKVLALFQKKFTEHYGIDYKPNYAVDCGKIKKQLISLYTDEQIEIAINIGITEYDACWKTPSYPTPTIGNFCGFVAQASLVKYVDRQKKNKLADRFADMHNEEDLVL